HDRMHRRQAGATNQSRSQGLDRESSPRPPSFAPLSGVLEELTEPAEYSRRVPWVPCFRALRSKACGPQCSIPNAAKLLASGQSKPPKRQNELGDNVGVQDKQ